MAMSRLVSASDPQCLYINDSSAEAVLAATVLVGLRSKTSLGDRESGGRYRDVRRFESWRSGRDSDLAGPGGGLYHRQAHPVESFPAAGLDRKGTPLNS